MRALSIRQPYAEMILRGVKHIEYRSRPTNIRERVYIYAAMAPGDQDDFKSIKCKPGSLPTGVLIGSVEIVKCTKKGDTFHWHLQNPKRRARPIKPKKHPQPCWFNPF